MTIQKKHLKIMKTKKEANKKAFLIIKSKVKQKPDSLIGFAVGKTTDSLHKLISQDVKKHSAFWEKIKVFQIDETIGISPTSKKSFNNELKTELKDLFQILKKENVFLMDGKKNPNATIKEAKRFIKKNDGFDIIILGIGPEYDPHIAYNTTGKSSMNSSIRIVDLHPLVSANLKPKAKGITIGIKEILTAEQTLVIAFGKSKAKSIELAFNGKIDLNKASASALQKHKRLTVILDKAASALL